MTDFEILSAQRATLQAEITKLDEVIDANTANELEKARLAEAKAALVQVETTLASTKQAVAERDAKARAAYQEALAEQHRIVKRQRELAIAIAEQKVILSGAWTKARTLVREYRNLNAGIPEITRRLFDLAETVKGANPMNDIDGDSGAVDEGFANLVSR
jgi:hypothetical protein